MDDNNNNNNILQFGKPAQEEGPQPRLYKISHLVGEDKSEDFSFVGFLSVDPMSGMMAFMAKQDQGFVDIMIPTGTLFKLESFEVVEETVQ